MGSIQWTKARPLVIPLLAPRVGDVVLDRGTIPRAAKHIEIVADGDVTVSRAKDALHLTGSIAPGRGASLRIRYPVRVDSDEVQLGFRGVVGRTYLAVATLSNRPARARISAEEPVRVGEQVDNGQRVNGLALLRPLRSGDVAHLRVSDLPANAKLPRRALQAALMLLILFAAAALLRRTP